MRHIQAEVCPTCKRKVSASALIRTCWKCKGPVTRHHKFRWIVAKVKGQEFTTIQHWNCKEPDAYQGRHKNNTPAGDKKEK